MSEPVEKVLCCLGVKWFNRDLNQLLKIQRNVTVDGVMRVELTERWEPVLRVKRYMRDDVADWESLDYTKTNTQLAYETGTSPAIVNAYRNRLGKPRSIPFNSI